MTAEARHTKDYTVATRGMVCLETCCCVCTCRPGADRRQRGGGFAS